MRCPGYPSSSITDSQWAVLEPLLPAPGNTRGRGGRREKHPRRLVLDAIFYLARGGIAWAALPTISRPIKPSTESSAVGSARAPGDTSTTRCVTRSECTRAATRCPPRRSSIPSQCAARTPCPPAAAATTPAIMPDG